MLNGKPVEVVVSAYGKPDQVVHVKNYDDRDAVLAAVEIVFGVGLPNGTSARIEDRYYSVKRRNHRNVVSRI